MDDGDQLALPGLPRPRKRRQAAGVPIAERDPVVSVLPDATTPHLDRPFDYLVPASMSDDVLPGVKVKVRLGARDVDAMVLDRLATSDFEGDLQPIRRVISPVVLAPEASRDLYQRVAAYYASNTYDVVTAAIPPRHARAENAVLATPEAGATKPTDPSDPAHAETLSAFRGVWHDYHGGAAFLSRLSSGQLLRAVWTPLPHAQHPLATWARGITAVLAMCHELGRGVVVVVPDDRDVAHLSAALTSAGLDEWTPSNPAGAWVRLQASQGPSARYGAYVAAATGRARIVIGTRSAAYAPVREPGLFVSWDDEDSSHIAERTPRTSTIELLRLRGELEGVSTLFAGPSRSLRAQQLVRDGWARAIEADRATVRHRAPRVRALSELDREASGSVGHARIPPAAWRVLTDGLKEGPVLVQVPRSGYIPALACDSCRELAHCRNCHGPLRIERGNLPDTPRSFLGTDAQCAWCGALAGNWRCPECGGVHLRSVRVGSQRTAEELGRAFPRVPVRISGLGTATGVLDSVGPRPCLVVATPGAEPRAEGGFAAAALLDGDVAIGLPGLGAETNALHRWLVAASLVRSADDGGQVVLVGASGSGAAGALVRWDPVGFADREYDERLEAELPPATRIAALHGASSAVAALLADCELPRGALVLGPAPWESDQSKSVVTLDVDHQVRALIKVPHSQGAELAAVLRAARMVSSTAKRYSSIRVELDPLGL
ncbi:primosomal protein N' [Rarobacter faecitabidus]|uniref:Probable replication restart protein PriA n=1 Tax=Rarobacter faecitabidus TaxID=13243 RepID=A0A542ZVS3_RARFA|nr:primosomal protein N' [Rarobacter faecitabidus]TQL64431.1 replication restart DNA helicase PriA [Rarobacter faecitabidus]